MLDAHYVNPKLTQIYDLDSGWGLDRDFYLFLADHSSQKILDLGCGTGLLCEAFAANKHQVTGADPSPEMLKIAGQKPRGKKIKWVCSTAQTFKSDERFDLIIMTGHAFQVLLEDRDVIATFKTMKKHLKPSGTIVFESRNPKIDWQKKWDYDEPIKLQDIHIYESRRFLKMEGNIMMFELSYQFPEEKLLSTSTLRFWGRQEIEGHLKNSGLYVEQLLGNWNGETFKEETSEEMIFIVKF